MGRSEPERRRLVGVALVALAGCGEAAAPTPIVVAAPVPVPPTTARDGRLVAARARSGPPRGFALDGAVAEWSLADPPPPTTEPDEVDPEAARPVRNAASHVALALTSTGAVIAGELTGDAAGGVWIALGMPSSPLPVLGTWTHGGWTEEARCQAPGEEQHRTGRILTEQDVQACQTALEEGAAFARTWSARFRRVYRVDASGVGVVTARGVDPVPDVGVAWKPFAGGVTFEATLPAAALPMCGDAPLSAVALAAAPTTGGPPPDDPSRWPSHDLDPPVGFEPHAEHRAGLFEAARSLMGLNGPLAYQPGDANGIERAGYVSQGEFPYTDRMRLQVYRSELVTKDRTFGDLEIGSIDGQGLAIWRGGTLLGTFPVAATAWVERDGELFGVSWSQWLSDETWTESASFDAFAIGRDGSVREALVRPTEPFFHWIGVDEVKPSEDLRTLIIRGIAAGEPHPWRRTTVVTWKYDARTRDWRPKVTHEPRAEDTP